MSGECASFRWESVHIRSPEMWDGIIFLLWGKTGLFNVFCSCRLCLPLGPSRVFSELIMDVLLDLLEISVFQGFVVFSPWRAFVPCHCYTAHNWFRLVFCSLSGWPALYKALLTKNAYRFSSTFSLCCIVCELKMHLVIMCDILHLVTWMSVCQSSKQPVLLFSSNVHVTIELYLRPHNKNTSKGLHNMQNLLAQN